MATLVATAALFLALASAALGLAFGPLRHWDALERWILALTGSVLALAVVSLALVRFGAFSPTHAAIPSSLLGLLAFVAARRAANLVAPESPVSTPIELWILVPVLALLLALYAFFPTYSLLGGQDPGVYLTFAAHIAKTGGLTLDLPWLRALADQHPTGFALSYPGIYSLANHVGANDVSRLSPQFMHLYPALAANVWSAFGLEGVVRLNAPLAVLALANGYALVRRLIGWRPALAFVLALGLNPAFLWAARITLTETLALLVNLAGFLLLRCSVANAPRFIPAAAGVVLGLGIFNRLDASLAGVAIAALGVSSLLDGALASPARRAAVAYVVVSLIAIGDGFAHAPFYVTALAERAYLMTFLAATTGAAALGAVLAWLPEQVRNRVAPRRAVRDRLADESVLLTAVWIAIALFLWPEIDPGQNARAAREMTWYITPVAWPLALLGLWLILRNDSRSLPFAAWALAAIIVFTVRTQAAPQHIWVSRRWLPQLIPGIFVLSSVAAGWLSRLTIRVGGVRTLVLAALALCYLVPTLQFDRPFAFRSMLQGLPAAYESAAARVRATRIRPPLVSADPNIAGIFTYVYDLPIALLGGDRKFGVQSEIAEQTLLRGDLGGMPAIGFDAFDLGNTVIESSRYVGPHLEVTQTEPPRRIVEFPVTFDLGVVGGPQRTLEVPAGHPRLTSNVGVPGPGSSVLSHGRAGLLQGGPCMTLGPGTYAVDWIGSVRQVGAVPVQGLVDVVTDPRQTVVTSVPLRVRPTGGSETWLAGVDFSAERTLRCVEFRLQIEHGVAMTLSRVRLARVADGAVRPGPY
jgi:hypothetical protein